MTVRNAQKEDIPALAAFADSVWHEHYDGLIGPGQVTYMVRNFQSEEAIAGQLAGGYRYFLAEDEKGNLLGYCGVHPEEDGRLFLSKLYVSAPNRRRGTGRALLSRAEAFAEEMHDASIWLTVNKHNLGSVIAYLKMGFQFARTLVTDIGNGFYMDDYVMEKQVRLKEK